MTIVLYIVLSTLAVLTDARPFNGRSNMIQPVQVSPVPDVILLVKFIEDNGGFLSLDRLVLVHQLHHAHSDTFTDNEEPTSQHPPKNK